MIVGIPAAFLTYACDILAHTNLGVSGSEVIKLTAAYAVQHVVDIPHPRTATTAENKRTALLENLLALPAPAQYQVLRALCDHEGVTHPKRSELKVTLLTQYRHLDTEQASNTVDETLIEETRHWLSDFPMARTLYEEALLKFRLGEFNRNTLDDLRAALEQLLKALLRNDKSLENQLPAVGGLIKKSGGSPELASMFHKLLEYFSVYQNRYVKHNHAVKKAEIEFVLEITSAFMKHLVRSRPKEE